MKFSKRKALAIIAHYNLSESTFNTWKHRGYIPDRYRDFKYQAPREEISEQEEKQQRNMVELLQNPCINTSTFLDAAMVSRNKLVRVAEFNGVWFSTLELNHLISQKGNIKEQLNKAIRKADVQALLTDVYLHMKRVILNNGGNNILYVHARDHIDAGKPLSVTDTQFVIRCYKFFVFGTF